MSKGEIKKQTGRPNERLRQARIEKGLSQREVADYLDLPDTRSLRRWEGGINLPRSYQKRKLAELYDQSLEDLGLLDPVNCAPLPSQQPVAILSDRKTEALAGKDAPFAENAGNLAPWFTPFIGRETEIARVRRLLAQPEVRLVTILGPGGVGKTRLAVEVARISRADFPDGVCQISLAALTDAVLVFPTIARELQLQMHEESQQMLVEALQRFFGRRRFLLVLDNFEHVSQACALLEELLAGCPGLKVLVTSRNALYLQAERKCTLDPFPLPERKVPSEDLLNYHAIQLFIQRTQAHLDTFETTPENLEIISNICMYLDGLPLAIELAATRVKLLGLSSLLQEIIHRPLSVLRSEIKTPLGRHQTLTETLAWSYHLLDEQEQWFFRQLTLFPGGCSLFAARALNRRSPFPATEALDVLVSLLDKNMIRPGAQKGDTPFFSMLETMREYGNTMLQQSGEWEAARQFQADYCLELLAEAESQLKGMQQGHWLARLDDERENLRAALSWLIECQESERALAFCEVFGKYCGLRGYWSEELHWLEAALAIPACQPATRLRGKILRRAGYIFYRLRNLQRALTLLSESAKISEACNDLSNLAGALNGLAWVHYRFDELEQAGQLFQSSVDVARASADAWSLANALESLGRFLHARGEIAQAMRCVEESISLARALEDRESLVRQLSALVLINIARSQHMQKDSQGVDCSLTQPALNPQQETDHQLLEESDALARECFSYALALKNKPLLGIALTCLGDTALAQNDLGKANDLYQQLLCLASEMDDRPTVAHTTMKLGKIALQQYDLAQATRLIQESLAFFQQQGDRPNIFAASQILQEIHQSGHRTTREHAQHL